jgi:hypothetical protein
MMEIVLLAQAIVLLCASLFLLAYVGLMVFAGFIQLNEARKEFKESKP